MSQNFVNTAYLSQKFINMRFINRFQGSVGLLALKIWETYLIFRNTFVCILSHWASYNWAQLPKLPRTHQTLPHETKIGCCSSFYLFCCTLFFCCSYFFLFLVGLSFFVANLSFFLLLSLLKFLCQRWAWWLSDFSSGTSKEVF